MHTFNLNIVGKWNVTTAKLWKTTLKTNRTLAHRVGHVKTNEWTEKKNKKIKQRERMK